MRHSFVLLALFLTACGHSTRYGDALVHHEGLVEFPMEQVTVIEFPPSPIDQPAVHRLEVRGLPFPIYPDHPAFQLPEDVYHARPPHLPHALLEIRIESLAGAPVAAELLRLRGQLAPFPHFFLDFSSAPQLTSYDLVIDVQEGSGRPGDMIELSGTINRDWVHR